MLQLMTCQIATLKNLENHKGQIASTFSGHPHGSFPNDTESNPKRVGREHCNVVTLRSGKQVELKEKLETEGPKQVSCHETNLNVHLDVEGNQPKIPFPQRLKKHIDRYFQKFLESLKKLYINIPFLEALKEMPKYAKFMEVLKKNKKLEGNESITLSEEYSAAIQNKLPPKLKDPGFFKIPCEIDTQFLGLTLADLVASVNHMPYSIFKRLGLGNAL